MENQENGKAERLTIDVTNMPTLEMVEREYINLALQKANGSKSKAAQILGVSVKTVYNKLAQHGTQAPSEP